ncbi:glycosyltransferase family 4 protein [Chelatococcus sp. GCM10030263]|uniref:glycosyltransferase family 4 protein n=1 Tax=Chelatococcus sp. GCM10030263 TaxID=3273387 RepID=UPI003619A4DF
MLIDLSLAAGGFTGIAQDTRLIFSMLAHDADISVGGLMYPTGRYPMPNLHAKVANDSRVATVLRAVSAGSIGEPSGSLPRRIYGRFRQLAAAATANHSAANVPTWLKTDMIWRTAFQKTLPAQQRARILESEFLVADLTIQQLVDRTLFLPLLREKQLLPGNWDAVLLPMPRPLRVPAHIHKVVRYHDAIPMTHSDTVGHPLDIAFHHGFTNSCAKDSLFVCNSPMSVDDLDNVAPGAGENAIVIPCAIQSVAPPKYRTPVHDIIAQRMSFRALNIENSSSAGVSLRRSIDRSLRQESKIRFIISVSSLEPRKNFNSAIAAWERLRIATGKDIKFVLVGNDGWNMDSILEFMRPHVLNGNLLHIQKVPFQELQVLYEAAELCLFPSYAEGFGYAPLEALQMRTPVVVSDSPVFRWSLEDAALFADPYSPSEITECAIRLLDEPENHERRLDLVENGARVLKRFSTLAVADKWHDFFTGQMQAMGGKMKK